MSDIKLGVSSCLLGNPVRYDGQQQRNSYLCDLLGRVVEWVPVCPEVECGLPVPRESMRLTGSPADPHLVTNQTGRDLTELMKSYVRRRLEELAEEKLDGFVFKKDSPSSGLERVRIYNEHGMPVKKGRGLFAGAFADRFPDLPVIEDGMLNDRFLRERFLNRIFTAGRWHAFCSEARSRKNLSDFHARHKLMLMSHAPGRYHELGQLVEGGDLESYRRKLAELLQYLPSIPKHVNVLHHILGYFKKDLDAWEKEELLNTVEDYRSEKTQIAVPMTLLLHYARKFKKEYLLNQTYWNILEVYYL